MEGIEFIDKGYYKPILNRFLKALGMDVRYHRAKGNYLFYGNSIHNETEVLDFAGGYGSLILGHNNDLLKEYSIELINKNVPIHSQLSCSKYANDLAYLLDQEFNLATNSHFNTILTNTGTEAVEAAIKHAKLVFSKKKEDLVNKAVIILNKIENQAVKQPSEVSIEFNGYKFENSEKFRIYYLSYIDKILEEITSVSLACTRAFHGKTSGSLEITHNEEYKDLFQTNKDDKKRVFFFDTDLSGLEEFISNQIHFIQIPRLSSSGKVSFYQHEFCGVISAIVEPIQGEGGIRVFPENKLKELRQLADKYEFPLIFDEIQCGFFRTGFLCYSFRTQIKADYYILGKSIGGGMSKIGAVLVNSKQYVEEFDLMHTSTFAGDEYSSAIAIKAFELAKSKAEDVVNIGDQIAKSLNQLKCVFPEVILEVRGEGLMIGIEFKDMNFSTSYALQSISRSGYLNYILCSFLLNKWQLRVAPTLSDSFTLRMLPSVLTTTEDIAKMYEALRDLCETVHNRDFYKLIEHLLPENLRDLRGPMDFGRTDIFQNDEKNLINVGFLSHLVDTEGARKGDPSLEILPDNAIEELLTRFIEFSTPFIANKTVVKSHNGEKVNVLFAGMLFTAKMARDKMLEGKLKDYKNLCNKTIDLLCSEFNCKVIGLGQYSSVILNNGKGVTNKKAHVTTGNSLTVGVGASTILKEVESFQLDYKILGVLGASGNICFASMQCLFPNFDKLVLKGGDSEVSKRRTCETASELIVFAFDNLIKSQYPKKSKIYSQLKSSETFKQYVAGELSKSDRLFEVLSAEQGENCPIQIAETIHDFKHCDVTMVATNHPKPFLKPEHFKPNSIVYDISVPSNSTQELIHNSEGIKVIMGGIIELPNGEDFHVSAFPLNKGEAFACVSETILLGLEKNFTNFSFGILDPFQIELITKVAEKHHFKIKKNKLEQIF